MQIMEDLKKYKKHGFSLVELMIGMGILAGATLGATKVMEILGQQTRNGEILTSLKTSSAGMQKIMSDNLNGLSELEFNKRFFYQLNTATAGLIPLQSSSNFNSNMLENLWLNKVLTSTYQTVYSSFGFVRKTKVNNPMLKEYERYFSVCLPIGDVQEYLNKERILDVEEIAQLEYWPFMRETSSGNVRVRCCKMDSPNCNEDDANPFTPETGYVLATVRHVYVHKFEEVSGVKTMMDDYPKEKVTLLLKKGDLRNNSGGGFYLYRSQNSLVSYTAHYYNDCVTRRIASADLFNGECNKRFKLQIKRRTFPINTKMGAGATDVGNIGW